MIMIKKNVFNTVLKLLKHILALLNSFSSLSSLQRRMPSLSSLSLCLSVQVTKHLQIVSCLFLPGLEMVAPLWGETHLRSSYSPDTPGEFLLGAKLAKSKQIEEVSSQGSPLHLIFHYALRSKSLKVVWFRDFVISNVFQCFPSL